MKRTNLVLPEELLEEATRLSGEKTYSKAVTRALQEFVRQVKARQILAVHYDQSGIVQAITQYGLEDAKSVAIVDRETPTAGNDVTLLQELFGDIGRFASPPGRSGVPGAR